MGRLEEVRYHLDEYELKNFNRQYGARMDTVNEKKAEIMKKEALKINPNCKIEVYEKGINKLNINRFLDGADLAIDGLDFFEIDIRRIFFNTAVRKGIPLITAGPLGFGSAFLIFMPNGPNFDEYFNVNDDTSYENKLLSFVLGLSPKFLQMPYMRNVSLNGKVGPSSIGAVDVCSGIITVYAIKILLNKAPIKAVPYYHQFDIMRDKYVVGRIPFGNKNPIQKLKLKIALRMMQK
ncbi:MAG: ThiF family adenylyltransferase [Nanoarchaeota archaeon]|nr:ThiF family adenylyltransferase [Nanoarchaeota archaeon]